MKSIYYSVIILMTFFIYSCEDEISNLNYSDQKIVVEAYLYAGQSIDSIRITKSYSFALDTILETIDDALITITNEEETITLNAIGNGYYQNIDHVVKINQIYELAFTYDSTDISAETFVHDFKDMEISKTSLGLEKFETTGGFPPHGNMDIKVVEISWNNDEQDYYFIDIKNTEEDPEYVNDFFANNADDEDRPELFFRSEPELMDFYSINSRNELQTYGVYAITVYRLNLEYASLYESLETTSVSLSDPPSNINNGFGIFTAVTPHYLTLEVYEL